MFQLIVIMLLILILYNIKNGFEMIHDELSKPNNKNNEE